MMNGMMQQTLLTGTARKAHFAGWPAAGKTGTSQDFRDAWFVGYTAHLVTGVWLGNDDDSPTQHVTGGSLPVEIWSRFMTRRASGRAGRRAAGCRRRRHIVRRVRQRADAADGRTVRRPRRPPISAGRRRGQPAPRASTAGCSTSCSAAK